MHNRKSKSENDKSLPRLKNWLETANEYEKEVVHKFVSSINNSMKENEQRSSTNGSSRRGSSDSKTRSQSATFPIKNKDIKQLKSVRIRSAPISAGSFPTTPTKINVSRRPAPSEMDRNENNVDDTASETKEDRVEHEIYNENEENNSRIPSRGSTSESQRSELSLRNVSTQMPYKYGSKPSSPLYDKTKSKSSPDLTHNCKQCETCRKKEVKKLLETICTNSPETYDYIRLQRALQPSMRTEVVIPQEDYIHASTSFHRVNGLKKRYFIIHPDFVSENGTNLRTKRRMQKKYFGESQVPAY